MVVMIIQGAIFYKDDTNKFTEKYFQHDDKGKHRSKGSLMEI